MPEALLLTVGAEVLAPAVTAAILGVASLYLWNGVLRWRGKQPVKEAEQGNKNSKAARPGSTRQLEPTTETPPR